MVMNLLMYRRAFGAGLVACALLAGVARAQDPSEVLLELVPPEGESLQLTRADLEALPQIEFETTTEWTEGSASYRGPRLADVLALAGLQGQPVEATAANDYKVTLTPELIGADYPIIALRINDKPFGLRALGPLWIVYPYDKSADYRSEQVFAASIWQLVRIGPVKD
jgi:hypothetical protein